MKWPLPAKCFRDSDKVKVGMRSKWCMYRLSEATAECCIAYYTPSSTGQRAGPMICTYVAYQHLQLHVFVSNMFSLQVAFKKVAGKGRVLRP